MPISEERRRLLEANNAQSRLEARTCIKNAFLSLLREKSYNEIRMTDIIRASEVSRSGVYKNYKNKEEILVDIYREPIEEILSALGGSIFENIELIFRIGKKHEASITAIISSGLEHLFLRRMNERFEGVSTSYYIPLWNGMIYNSFIEWARSGMTEPVDVTIEKVKQGLKMVAESIDTGLTNKTQNHRLP